MRSEGKERQTLTEEQKGKIIADDIEDEDEATTRKGGKYTDYFCVFFALSSIHSLSLVYGLAFFCFVFSYF